jgi:hypothetical protein
LQLQRRCLFARCGQSNINSSCFTFSRKRLMRSRVVRS